MIEGQNVGLGQVVHVDVVADAGAVGGVVIAAEYGDRLAGQHGAQQQRDQVGFGLVLLAKLPFRVAAGGVEIPEADAGEVVNLVEPAKKRLHHDLRLAVRIHRVNRRGLGDRRDGRVAVNRRRGREDNVPTAGFHHGPQQG